MGLGTDPQILIDVLEFKKKYNYPVLVETGTYHGTSSAILADHFDKVYTCEISDEEKEIREEKLATKNNIVFMLGSSEECLPKFFKEIGNDKFFLFLDAHWSGNFPILEELQIVADFGFKPFIFIHDFDCGHPGWKYDSDGNRPLNHEYVKDKMDLIYGENNYDHTVSQISQNSSNSQGEDLRGCGFYFPKI